MSRRYPRVSIHYTIHEGERWKIGSIAIKGLRDTKESFVRSQISLKPGDQANVKKLNECLSNLNKLTIFKSIEYHWGELHDGVRDLVFETSEKPDINFSTKLGFESEDGILWAFRLSLENIGGRGQSVSLDNDTSPRESLRRILYEDPLLFHYDLTGRVALAQKEELLTTQELKNRRYITELSLQKDWDTKLSQILSLSYREDQNPKGTEKSFRLELFSKEQAARPAHSPSIGFGSSILNSLTNYIGGSSRQAYIGDYTFSFGFKLGGSIATPWVRVAHSYTFQQNFSIPLADRFFLGGVNSLRGYQEDEVAGADGEGGESLISYGLQIFYPFTSWVDGTIFYEGGEVFSESFVQSAFHPSTSVGLGVLFRTPVGPLQGFFARPVGGNKDGRLGLQIGTIF